MFDPQCHLCPRLIRFLDEISLQYPNYHARPVAPFGVANPDVLIVGLAPGMHGANASGRPFTGDQSGVLLYQTLFDYGFSNQPVSGHAEDGLLLKRCCITNAVKCLPPQNKPTTDEVKTCGVFLKKELQALKPRAVVIALGSVAHAAILRAFSLTLNQYAFGHANEHALPNDLVLLDSYHCSRYNTQTKRLTRAMFQQIFARAKALIDL